jgi:hypothetical protein
VALVTVAPRRTLHLRFNDLERPEAIPRDTPYLSVFESDVPDVVQCTRLDSRRRQSPMPRLQRVNAPNGPQPLVVR